MSDSPEGDIFRTFCHISDYGEAGYENLHRMLAASAPLVLWSPSSVQIESSACRLAPREFINLVEAGAIRVIGREDWILSRPFRNNHRWAGARWVPEIDEALKSIATNDQLLPVHGRRVALAENEQGSAWADRHLEKNPILTDQIYSAITAPGATSHFPPGVTEKALAAAEDATSVVRRVVRDAYNHDAAIALSGTRTPFLLTPREARFHQLLESVRISSDTQFPPTQPVDDLNPEAFSDLTAEVLKVLEHLETSGATKLSTFMRSGGQEQLARWMEVVCESLNRTDAKSVRGEVIARLRSEFDSGRLHDNWSDIFATHHSLVGSFGTGIGTAEAVASELSIYGALGLATGAYAIGHGLAQKLGYAEVDYSGPQWAFIYAFGRRASGRRKARMQQTLDLLTPD
ncbi:hypothetical protein GCM10028784_30550 [Myceligenerans cantabricum]